MKKLLYLFILINIATSIFAGNSELTLKTWDNAMISVTFGETVYQKPVSKIIIKELNSGVYPIEIVQHVIGEYGYSEVIYSGWITIPENSEVQAVINRHNMVNIYSIKPVSDDNQNHQKTRSDFSISEFNMLMSKIKGVNFDRERMQIAKDALQTNKLMTSIQIYQIASFFVFERSKIEFVKYAYEYTIDKENFSDVYSAFTHRKSINKLSVYVNAMTCSH